MTCYRRMLRISFRQHRTNASVLDEVGEQNQLLQLAKARKLRYFGHVVRARNLCTSILHERIDGTRRRGRPRRRWTDDILDWSGMSIVDCIHAAEDRARWRSVVSASLASNLQQWGSNSSSSSTLGLPSSIASASRQLRWLYTYRVHAASASPWVDSRGITPPPLSRSLCVWYSASYVLGSGHVPLDVPLGHFPGNHCLK